VEVEEVKQREKSQNGRGWEERLEHKRGVEGRKNTTSVSKNS